MLIIKSYLSMVETYSKVADAMHFVNKKDYVVSHFQRGLFT